jgi:hypothetical protein
MKPADRRLRPGDLVDVKRPEDILRTLDANGTVRSLPFMPEMIQFCGRQFRVSRRVVKTCFTGSASTISSTMLAFQTDDVVTLEGVRCSGASHDGCQKDCMIFWRDAWLRKVIGPRAEQGVAAEHTERLRGRLKTNTGQTTYFCQASELLKAAHPLTRSERLGKCLAEIRAGNCTAWQMAQRLAIWMFWRIRRVLRGPFARGPHKGATPAESLKLSPGEQVTVKPIESIRETVNEAARNRGLSFSPDMRLLCGATTRVKSRMNKIIVDGSGEMRQLRNTVALEGSFCGCAEIAFGGCSRCDVTYWREIGLRRSSQDVHAC